MLRITKLIGRDKIFDYLKNPKVTKVELNNRENKSLKNPFVCRIYLYLDTQIKDTKEEHINMVLGNCKRHENLKIPFLKGIVAQKELGWLSATHIKKLMEIEKTHDIDLCIPNYFLDLIDTFEDKK